MSATVTDGVGAKGDALTAMVKKFNEGVSPHVPINVNSVATPHRKMSIAEFGHVEFFVCADVPVVCGVLMNIASVLLMQ